MPTGAVASLFKRHNRKQGIAVKTTPPDLDVAASREGDKFFLRIANMNYSRSIEASLAVEGQAITGGRVLELAPEGSRREVSPLNPDVYKPQEHALVPAPVLKWRFRARSVSAIELDVHPS